MQCIHDTSRHLAQYPHSIHHPMDEQINPRDLSKNQDLAAEQFRTLLNKTGIVDSQGKIISRDLTHISLPLLDEKHKNNLKKLLETSFTVTGRIPAHPLNLQISILDILGPFYFSHEVFLTGGSVWKLLGDDYFENYFKNISDLITDFPQLPATVSNLLKEKTSKDGDIDLVILIKEPKELQKFYDALNLAHTKTYPYHVLYDYLQSKQEYLREKNDPSNYSFQVLANADLQNMTMAQMKQIVLELNCFEMAKNVKENGFEFYIRSITATDGKKYDFTFVVSSSFYAFTLQGLNLPLRAYDKNPSLRPHSFHPNPHQVIFDVNSGTIRLKSDASFSDRELALFYTLLTRGNLHIEKDTEKIITAYVAANLQQSSFPKKILDLIHLSNRNHFNNSLTAAFCLYFNICAHLKKILPDSKGVIETLHQAFIHRFKGPIDAGDILPKLLSLSNNFSITQCFLKIWALAKLSSTTPSDGYDILFDGTDQPQNIQLRFSFKNDQIKSYINLSLDAVNLKTFNSISEEEFETFLNFLAFELNPQFKFLNKCNKPLEKVLAKILSAKESLNKTFGSELEIYFLMMQLTSCASQKELLRLLGKLFDDSLLNISPTRRSQICDLLLSFLKTAVSPKTLDLAKLLLQEYCHPTQKQLAHAKIKLWSYLPEVFPSSRIATNYWFIYSTFAPSLAISEKYHCFELAEKYFSLRICKELLNKLMLENDPALIPLKWQFSLQILIKDPEDRLALSHMKDCLQAFKAKDPLLEIDKIKKLYLHYLQLVSLEFFSEELVEIIVDLLSKKILHKDDLKSEFREKLTDHIAKSFFEPLCHVSDLLFLIQRLEKFFEKSNHCTFKAFKKQALLHFFYLCHSHPEKLVHAYQPKIEFIFASLLKTFDDSEKNNFLSDLGAFLSDHLFFKTDHPLFYIEWLIKLILESASVPLNTIYQMLAKYIDYSIETNSLVKWPLIEPLIKIENACEAPVLINLYYLLIRYEKQNLFSFLKFHETILFYLKEKRRPSFFSTLLQYYEKTITSLEDPLRSPAILALGHYYYAINNYDKALEFYKISCLYERSEVEIQSLIGKVFESVVERPSLATSIAQYLQPLLSQANKLNIQSQLFDLLHENKLERFVSLSIALQTILHEEEYLEKVENFLMDPTKNFQQNLSYLRILLYYFEKFSFLSLKNLNRFIYQLYSNNLNCGGLEHLLYRNCLLINYNSKTGNSCLYHLFLYTAKTQSFTNWKKILLCEEVAHFQVFRDNKKFSSNLGHVMMDSWLEMLAADPKYGSEVGGCVDLIPPLLVEHIYWEPSLYSKLAKIYLYSSDPHYFFKGARILDDVDSLANLSYEEILYFGNSFKPYIAGFYKLNIPIDQTHFKLIVNTTLLAFAVQEIAPRDWLNFMIVFEKFIDKNPEINPNLKDYCKKFCQFITSKARDTKLTKKDLKAFRTIINYSHAKGYFCKACLSFKDQERWLNEYHTKHSQSCLQEREIQKFHQPDYLSDRLINASMDLLKKFRPFLRKVFSGQHLLFVNSALTFLLLSILLYVNLKKGKPARVNDQEGILEGPDL